MIPGDRNQYGGPLHAAPDHDQGERPWYAPDDLWQFKIGADNTARFDLALDFIHDLSLTAEVSRFCETSSLFTQYQEDICKLEVRMWEVGQMKDASVRRLEGANACHGCTYFILIFLYFIRIYLVKYSCLSPYHYI